MIRFGRKPRFGLLAAITLAALPLLSACAAIDAFSPRASDFNQETSDTKSASILANIVRAAYAEPLQFTDISTAQGAGNVQASTGSTLPFPFRGGFGVPLAQQFLTFTPGGQASASNQFVVQNLNTQEFYNGIQAPISTQLIAYLMSSGLDKRILLNLLISEIEITHNGRKNLIQNNIDPAREGSQRASYEYFFFYQALSYLIEEGFSGEQISDSTPVGPPLSPEQASDPRLLSALVNPTGTDSLGLKETPDKAAFQLTKKNPGFRFCFDPTKIQNATTERRFEKVKFVSTPSKPQSKLVVLGKASNDPIPELAFRLNPGHFCGADAKTRAVAAPDLLLKFRTRSVEGVFNFLGKMVRTQLGLSDGQPTPLTIPGGSRPSFDLFRVETDPGGVSTVAITHHGHVFGFALDPSGLRNGSSRVVQLLTTLIALQSSVKNQPAPNLITVLGP